MESLTETTARLVVQNPRFVALVRARARVRWGLTALIVAAFFGFVLLVVFDRALLAMPVGDGLAPLGLYLAVGMELLVVAITGFYVWRAGSLFGRMNDELVRELGL